MKKELEKELESLLKFSGTKQFDKQLDLLYKKYKDRAGYKKIVADFLRQKVNASAKNIEKIENEISLKKQLGEISEIVSLSYISRVYFGKTRSWLHQRINGNIVNGKNAQFTDSEMRQFKRALKDISKKLGSLSITG
jgi:hypothetical protein